MPIPNRLGQFEHGIGGGQVSIDNVAFSIGGAGGWIADTLAGYINGEDPQGWLPWSYDTVTGEKTRLLEIHEEQHGDRGANNMFSGGGQWAAFRPTTDPARGLYSSTGLRLPDAQPLAVGPDGALCYKPLYQSNGPMVVREVDGSEWTLSGSVPILPDAIQLLGAHRAIWIDVVAGLSVVGLPTPVIVPGGAAYRPRACFFAGEWWICYFHTALGVILHPFNRTIGWVIVPTGQNAWQEVVAMDTAIRVGWGTTQGEQPGQLRRIEIDVARQLRIDLDTGKVTAAPAQQLVPHEQITPVNKTMYQGWFVGQSNATELGFPAWDTDIDWRTLPGNCRIEIPDGLWKDRQDRIIADYVQGAPEDVLDEINKAIARKKAQTGGRAVLAYWPAKAWPQDHLPTGAEYIGVEAYMKVGESDAAFDARVRQEIRRVLAAGLIPVLFPQCYTSNKSLTDNLTHVAVLCSKIAAEEHIYAIVAFSGTGRATGLWQHDEDQPTLRPTWEQIAATIRVPEGPPMADPLKVTINPDYSKQIAAGKPAHLRADLGRGLSVLWEKTAGDSVHLSVFENGVLADRSGLERHVDVIGPGHVDPPDPPVDPPVDPPAAGVRFIGDDGQHELGLKSDKETIDGRAGGGAGLVFTPITDGDKWAFLTTVKKQMGNVEVAADFYLQAENGGGGRAKLVPKVTTDRPDGKPGAHERFTVAPAGVGGVSLQAADGPFLCMEGGGGGEVHVNRGSVGGWETLTPTRPFLTPGRGDRGGIVIAEGKAQRDDNGRFNPLGTSLMWAIWGWKNDRARTRQNLEFAADHGIDYFRGLGQVGGASWSDRVIDPFWPDYVDIVQDLLDTAWRSFKMRMEITIFGGPIADPDAVVGKVIDAISGRHHIVQDIEIANEAFQNFPDQAKVRSLCQRVRAAFPGLVATSSPGGAWTSFDLDVANLGNIHSERQASDRNWRQPRQPHDIPGLTTTGSNNEPPGPQSSVAVLDSPVRLAALRHCGTQHGLPAFVLHTGAGVRGGGAADIARGRSSNLWEVPNIEAICKALRACDALLPDDLPKWRVATQHGSDPVGDNPLYASEIWEGESPANGCNRHYVSTDGNRFVALSLGAQGQYDLIATRRVEGTVYDMETGAQVSTFQLDPGGRHTVSGDPNADKAFVIVGTRS